MHFDPYVTRPLGGAPPLRSGKVRDLFACGEHLLLVASDRLSAFDVVMQEPVPGKGIVLTAVTDFWFRRTVSIVPNHRLTVHVGDMPLADADDRARLAGRTMLCRKATPFPFELVVRGYLSGSGWSEYQQSSSVCGVPLPRGLRESDALPAPALTPTTKEQAGHDRPSSFDEMARELGAARAARVRDIALELYRSAAEYARTRGIILADTKFELGEAGSEILLIDEALTPDSSRFWPADAYKPGGPQPSFDKQFVRDYLLSTGWKKTPPPPRLPADVIEKTAAKYADICRRLTGATPEEFYQSSLTARSAVR